MLFAYLGSLVFLAAILLIAEFIVLTGHILPNFGFKFLACVLSHFIIVAPLNTGLISCCDKYGLMFLSKLAALVILFGLSNSCSRGITLLLLANVLPTFALAIYFTHSSSKRP